MLRVSSFGSYLFEWPNLAGFTTYDWIYCYLTILSYVWYWSPAVNMCGYLIAWLPCSLVHMKRTPNIFIRYDHRDMWKAAIRKSWVCVSWHPCIASHRIMQSMQLWLSYTLLGPHYMVDILLVYHFESQHFILTAKILKLTIGLRGALLSSCNNLLFWLFSKMCMVAWSGNLGAHSAT